MLSLAISDTVLVLVRPDRQDFTGTAILVQVAEKVGVPSLQFVANKVSDVQQAKEIGAKLEEAFGFPVAGVLQLCEEVARLGSEGIFAAKNDRHPFTRELERIAQRILPVPVDSGGRS